MIADALNLTVYFGEGVSTGAELMERLAAHGVEHAVLLRGAEGFGINRRIHAGRFPDVSTDLPLVAFAVGERERISAALTDVDAAVPRGLLTLEGSRLATGADVARAEFPDGDGRAAKLIVLCGGRERAGRAPAYRAVVATLRRHGAAGAVVLPGVDGLLRGRRERNGLWSAAGNAPMAIISVGSPDVLQRTLPHIAETVPDAVVTLERLVQLKHDGELLEPLPPLPASDDVWQAIRVYTRRSARVAGGPLYAELGRRIREAGGAGVTTILGDWGFSSDERPHGDRFGRIASHRPSYTVFVDHPERVARLWPLIDELTAEHGIVTARLVPGYLERAEGTTHGSLELAEREARPPALTDRPAPPPAASDPPWLAELRIRAREFAASRGVYAPVLRVTLADGERFYLWRATGGPGPGHVTLIPHPERYDELVGASGAAPRAVVVPERSIAKLELLARPPRGTRSLVAFEVGESS